jgi:hypothetical protein
MKSRKSISTILHSRRSYEVRIDPLTRSGTADNSPYVVALNRDAPQRITKERAAPWEVTRPSCDVGRSDSTRRCSRPTPPKYRRVASPPAVARGRMLYTASPTNASTASRSSDF